MDNPMIFEELEQTEAIPALGHGHALVHNPFAWEAEEE